MDTIRKFINSKPWLGWGIAVLFLGVCLFLVYRMNTSRDPYSLERMSEVVTIKCFETGEEWTMNRGMMEKSLRNRGSNLNPGDGIPNPKTGRLTGFPINKTEWESTIARINKEKEQVRGDKTTSRQK